MHGSPDRSRLWIRVFAAPVLLAAATVTGLDRRPLLPGWAWLGLIAGLILTGWLAEGRRRPA